MTRHIVIAAKDFDRHGNPFGFVELALSSGEDGLQWSGQDALGRPFEEHLRRIVTAFSPLDASGNATHIDPGSLPNISLTSRKVEDVIAHPPLVSPPYKMATHQPELSLTILAPIKFETPARTRFEMWASMSRESERAVPNFGNRFTSGPASKFIARELGNTLLPRTGIAMNHEVWVRPQWELINPELQVHECFPQPRTDLINGRTPEEVARMERDMLARGMPEEYIDRTLGRQTEDDKRHDAKRRRLIERQKASIARLSR